MVELRECCPHLPAKVPLKRCRSFDVARVRSAPNLVVNGVSMLKRIHGQCPWHSSSFATTPLEVADNVTRLSCSSACSEKCDKQKLQTPVEAWHPSNS